MEVSVIWFGAAAAILLAFLFFGIIGIGASGTGTEFTNIPGVKKEYGNKIEKGGKCDVIYIGTYYESLHIKADNAGRLKMRRELEKKVLGYSAERGAAARVDANNFIIAATPDRAGAEEFVRTLMADEECARLLHISIGVYEAAKEDFRTASGYAKKAARFARETKDGYVFCNDTDIDAIIESEHIEKNIGEFIKNDSFYLMFQPFTDALSGKIVGCEALTRLKGDFPQEILPGKFLGSVKKEKLCREFDLYTLKKCCEWAAENAQYGIFVACNVSRVTLLSRNICEDMLAAVKGCGAAPEKIIIEVEDEHTETEFDLLHKNIAELKRAGFKICLDNFGKGYTALGELSVLLPDIIGIDKSVLYGTSNDRGASVFKNAVKLAGEMSARVLCEGIETAEQAQSARDAGCDILQGYYICRPVSENDLDKLLKNGKIIN